MTTLREIFTQKSKRYGPIKVHIDPNTREKVSNVYHKSLVENAKRGEKYDTETLYEIIERLELDPKKREEKLAEFDEIKDDHVILTKFITSYNADTQMEVEALQTSYDFPSINEQWYKTFSISPPDVIRTLPTDSYDATIQQDIRKIITQPDVQKVIATQFMEELKQRIEYYKKYYDAKSTINKRENDLMIVLRSDNNLSELLERITESRAANANTWLPAFSRVFAQRAITGDIKEREKFYVRMRVKTGVVADTNATCARAAAYYTLFQTLVNEIGTYLSNKRAIPYTTKPIITVKCDIITTQPIDLDAAAETVVEGIETKGKISPPEVKTLESAVATVVEQVSSIEAAATDIFDDELAKKIAVAAVAVLLEDFEREHTNGAVAAINPDAVVTTVVVDKAAAGKEKTNAAAKAEAAKAEAERVAKAEAAKAEAAKAEAEKAEAERVAKAAAEREAEITAKAEAGKAEMKAIVAAYSARRAEEPMTNLPPGPTELPPLDPTKKYISEKVKEVSYRAIIGKIIPGGFFTSNKPDITEERWIGELRMDPYIGRAWRQLDDIDKIGFTLYDKMKDHPELEKYESQLIEYSKSIGEKLNVYIHTPISNSISNLKKKNAARSPFVSEMDRIMYLLPDIESELKKYEFVHNPLFINRVISSSPIVSAPVAKPVPVAKPAPVAKPVPVAKPAPATNANALNTLVSANPLSKKRNLSTKIVPALTNAKKLELEMKTLTKHIDAKQTQILQQFAYMKETTRAQQIREEIDNLMQTIDDRMTQLNDIYMKNPNIHYKTITESIAECNSLLERINGLMKEIQTITETNGGKRRTQKKRKQKKRFGSQKKRV